MTKRRLSKEEVEGLVTELRKLFNEVEDELILIINYKADGIMRVKQATNISDDKAYCNLLELALIQVGFFKPEDIL